MAEIVNLNKARKAKAKAGREAKAVENRAKFGRSKAEKACDAVERARIARAVDEAKRD
jgi:Spy/CpxP family protein refolding chaperone